jgi:hypothetical protein
MRDPASAAERTYVCAIAPATSPHGLPAAAHRRHCHENEVGSPVQAPRVAVSVWPSRVSPDAVGSAVLTGAFDRGAGGVPGTAAVGAESALRETYAHSVCSALQSYFVAVTVTRIRDPASSCFTV